MLSCLPSTTPQQLPAAHALCVPVDWLQVTVVQWQKPLGHSSRVDEGCVMRISPTDWSTHMKGQLQEE